MRRTTRYANAQRYTPPTYYLLLNNAKYRFFSRPVRSIFDPHQTAGTTHTRPTTNGKKFTIFKSTHGVLSPIHNRVVKNLMQPREHVRNIVLLQSKYNDRLIGSSASECLFRNTLQCSPTISILRKTCPFQWEFLILETKK